MSVFSDVIEVMFSIIKFVFNPSSCYRLEGELYNELFRLLTGGANGKETR